ncbi:MAG TPA: hypothetical protein VKO42_03025 [Patescibacteria group bacterium]|nr:hypothetical protein [Patescibacteria group bacterium]
MPEFKMPEWMDCTWRRVACGRDDCPLCGKINKQRQKHIEKGEDPDDLRCVFEDVSENFKETFELLEKDAEKMGIDLENVEDVEEPPRAEEYELYKKVKEWRNDIMEVIKQSDAKGAAWLWSEAGKDLAWYTNTIIAKTYRQLSNRWELDRGYDYAKEDFDYTYYVLEESLKILDEALSELGENVGDHGRRFYLAQIFLRKLKGEILNI